MKDVIYLATTGINEIWDLEKKMILLGPWCLTEEHSKEFLKGKDFSLISSPWLPTSKIKEALSYCNNIYKDLLPELSEVLNSIHRESYPDTYWQILIGPWILHFVEIIYDRFKRIENAFQIYPDSYTHALPLTECNISSSNTEDFLGIQVNDDLYNLKLFSSILHEIYPEKIKVCHNAPRPEDNLAKINAGWKIKSLNKLLEGANYFFKSPIILSDMYHLSLLDMFLLKLKGGLRLVDFMNFVYEREFSAKDSYSQELRGNLTFKSNADKFRSLLCKLIPRAIPRCYLEYYNHYKTNFKNTYPFKAIGSAVGWVFNERFKFFAAKAASEGANLIEFQHGAGYGTSQAVAHESLFSKKDTFYTWGWVSEDGNKTKPLPSPHLSKIYNTHVCKYNKIIFIGTGLPRYVQRLYTEILPDDMQKYFADKKILLQNLSDEAKNSVFYRPYPHEYGWKETGFIKDSFPNIKFLDGIDLIKLMQKAKLIIIDHPGTSFLEALIINVPCILYWDHDVHLMRAEAEEYFELLRKAGILYDNPVNAAKKINAIFYAPNVWWLSNLVQSIRFEFCQRFAHTRPDWMKFWINEFKEILNKA